MTQNQHRKIKGIPAWIIVLALIATIATVSAGAFYVWSSTVTVHVTYQVTDYALTLNTPTDINFNVPSTFTGSLTVNGQPIAGAEIAIINQDAILDTIFATTIADGTFSVDWTPTAVGDYTFAARYNP